MRSKWAVPVLMVAFLALAAMPSQACIFGLDSKEFEPQTLGAGAVFSEITPVVLSTIEELFPYAVSFKDSLYVVWQKENFTDDVRYFVTMRSYDGTKWSDTVYLSSPDMTQMVRSELNLAPRLGVSDGALYCIWTSTEPNWTTGPDDDVVFRYTEDGETWSEVIEVTGHYNTGLDKQARVSSVGGKTWFVWETTDTVDSDGPDMDIVMRSWDGHEFGQVIEVSPNGDTTNDFFADVAVDEDDGLMYITWLKANYTGGSSIFDTYGRVFDGHEFLTPPMKVSSEVYLTNEHVSVAAGGGHGYFIWETRDTGKVSDPTSVVTRPWSRDGGLGHIQTVSSIASNGKDSKPNGLWWDDTLFIAWTTTDQGVTFGDDADLVFRKGEWNEDGRLEFGEIVEVSDPSDEYTDRFPDLVVYDGVVDCVWLVDNNYSDVIDPDLLESLGGVFASPDVCIKSIDIPFEKSLNLVYKLGTAVPKVGKATTAEVTVTDLSGRPVEGVRVGLTYLREGQDVTRTRLKLMLDEGGGLYTADGLEFSKEGGHSLTIRVNDVEVGTFTVVVDPPPPSFVDRVPTAGILFAMAGVVTGGYLYRAMGRDELVTEIRPAPLEARMATAD